MSESKVNTVNAFSAFYEASKTRLTKKIDAYNESVARDGNPLIQPFQKEFARMNQGGKCLRGMLVNLGYQIAGGADVAFSDDLAIAFELFQTAVLIHDDVIDKADTRRDQMTIHKAYQKRLAERSIRMVSASESAESLSMSAAICAGDLGLFYSNYQLAQHYRNHPHLGDLILYFDQVIIDTIRGELLDVILPYELQDAVYSEEERGALLERSVMEIYHLKTAFYSVIGPLHLGMILGGMPEEQMKQLDEICDDLGIAFQIKDDILGIFADAEETGKDAGSDISEFKQTILYQYVMNHVPTHKDALLRYYGREHLSSRDRKAVQDLFYGSGAYGYAVDTMEQCFKRASRKLKSLDCLDEDSRAILSGFISYLRDRTK